MSENNVDRFNIGATNGYVGVNQQTPTTRLDIAGSSRVSGTPTDPTTGAGMEFSYRTTYSDILSYDRTGSAFKELQIRAQPIKFNNGTGEVGRLYAGDFLLGTTVSPTGTIGKTMVFGDNGGDPTPGINTCSIYGKDVGGTVEFFAVDEAANAVQLTSHPSDAPEYLYDDDTDVTPPRIHKDVNFLLGTIQWVNVTRQARLNEMLINGDDLPTDPSKRKIIIDETFDEYNERTGSSLEVIDWNSKQQKAITTRNKEIAELEISLNNKKEELSQLQSDRNSSEYPEDIDKLISNLQIEIDNINTPEPIELKSIPQHIKKYIKL